MPAFPDPETYRDILDALQIGVSVLDLQKKIVFWSDGAEQITGYAASMSSAIPARKTFFCTVTKSAVKCAPGNAPWRPLSTQPDRSKP